MDKKIEMFRRLIARLEYVKGLLMALFGLQALGDFILKGEPLSLLQMTVMALLVIFYVSCSEAIVQLDSIVRQLETKIQKEAHFKEKLKKYQRRRVEKSGPSP